MPRTPGETTPRQFRLKEETLTDLDLIAAHLTQESAVPGSQPASRTDAIRYAARQAVESIVKKKSREKPRKTGDSD